MTNTAMKAGHDNEQSLTQTINTQKGRETVETQLTTIKGDKKTKEATKQYTWDEDQQNKTHTKTRKGKGIKGNM